MKLITILSVVISQFMIFSSCTNFKVSCMEKKLKTIADPNSSKDSLLKAMSDLNDMNEGSLFWSDIANSDKFNNDHRRRAAFMLFKRHVKPNTTLQEVGKILKKPTWLQYENIHVIDLLIGEIPVNFNLNNTAISIIVFPELPKGEYERWAIYISVEGKISAKDFYKIISSGGEKGSNELKKRKLLEFGLSPDSPEQNH